MQNDEVLEVTSFLNSIPDCLTPIYLTESSNMPVRLYDGPVSIDIEGDMIESNAIITFEWLPSPAVVVQTSLAGFNFINFEQSPKIKVPNSVNAIPMSIPRLTISGGEKGSKAIIEGRCESAIIFDESSEMKYAIFHLVNFTNLLDGAIRKDSHVWKGRSIVNFDGWMLTIDSVNDIKQVEESLKVTRGYAITHVARLECIDKSLFSVEQAKKSWMDYIGFYLLPVAYDHHQFCP